MSPGAPHVAYVSEVVQIKVVANWRAQVLSESGRSYSVLATIPL